MGKAKTKNQAPQGGENATPETPAPAAEGVLDDLAGAIAAEAPQAQPGVMAAYAADLKAPPEAPVQQPKAAKKGRPLKPESELKQPRRVKVPNKDAQPAVPPGAINAETAAFVTGAKEQILCALIGPEWKLAESETALENALLTASLDRYAPAGLPVNPLAMYAVISASHAAKRFSQPATKSWWDRTKTRAAAWWLARKMKKDKQNATHSDRGPHDDGKNNPGNATGAQDQGGSPSHNS